MALQTVTVQTVTVQTVVFDASAVMTWAKARPGVEKIERLLFETTAPVYLHRQNAVEFWYQVHRTGALASFLADKPERFSPDGRPDLTGLDLNDRAVFDAEAGKRFADATLLRVEAAGVRIVGDGDFPDLWKRAGAVKSRFRRVSLADCFGVALSVELRAPFWTSDRHELEALQSAGVAEIVFIR